MTPLKLSTDDSPFHDDEGGTTTVAPKRTADPQSQRKRQPRYQVILWDSDVHSYDYVEKMLRAIFGHVPAQCRKIAETVDAQGKATVLTTTLEHAELKRDQIHAYGKDDIQGSLGSMHSTIEAIE